MARRARVPRERVRVAARACHDFQWNRSLLLLLLIRRFPSSHHPVHLQRLRGGEGPVPLGLLR